jgi:AcrR family transcriptional regulator
MSKGMTATTTLEVARLAGVSKRDLYAAFPSKEAMLEALIAGRVERMASAFLFPEPQSRLAVLATLEGFARGLLTFLSTPEVVGLYRVAIAQADAQPGIGQTLAAEGIDGTTRRVEAYVTAATTRGFLRLASPDEAARVFLSVANGQDLMRRLLVSGHEFAADRAATQAALALKCLLALETR